MSRSTPTRNTHINRWDQPNNSPALNSLSVTWSVFTDKHNRDRIGEIVKLNPKTAGLLCEDGTRWRVSYGLLFSILDADGRVKTEFQPRLSFDDSSG